MKRRPPIPTPRLFAGKTDPMLTLKEVAERDHCAVKTVKRAIDQGLLEAVRIGPTGRAIRVPEDAYARYRALCAMRK
jgi:excisionase family DNA binding protein